MAAEPINIKALSKYSPVITSYSIHYTKLYDATLPEGELRRTRAAQVAAALWRSGPDEISLVCFRSVAGYMMGLLEVASRKGGEIF